MQTRRQVVVFDFDGTLVLKDSLLEFIKFVKGHLSFYVGILLCSPVLFAYQLGLCSNSQAKEFLFKYFFKGMRYDIFCQYGQSFVRVINEHENHEMVNKLYRYKDEGCLIYIVSASMAEWVRPWADEHGVTGVIGTEIEVDARGIITGRFASRNCYGQEKVRRLMDVEPARQNYHLVAFGDSRGDKEMLSFADEGFLIGKNRD